MKNYKISLDETQDVASCDGCVFVKEDRCVHPNPKNEDYIKYCLNYNGEDVGAVFIFNLKEILINL